MTSKSLRIHLSRLLACGALVVAAASVAAQQPSAAGGLVPPALLSAKSIFISNAGADSGLFPQPFSGDPSRGYMEFYSELKASGFYKIVDDPRQADLVLELQLTAPYGPSSANKQNGASDPLPMFRLVIYEAGTHYVLWALTTSIDPALIQKTHDRNFDQALERLLTDFEEVTGKLPSGPR